MKMVDYNPDDYKYLDDVEEKPTKDYSSGFSYNYDWGSSWGGIYKEATSRYKSSLGWDSGRLTSTISGFGSKYYSSSSDIEKKQYILRKAYETTRDMVVVMDFPFNVDVTFSNRHTTSENSRRIFVPTTVLDDKDYTDQEKITIFSGLGTHEASHLRYTEYKVISAFIDDSMTRFDFMNPMYSSFLRFLMNIIEDGRVEDNLLSERPGYAELIEKAKLYQYKEFINACNDIIKRSDESKKRFGQFLTNLFRMIRYPKDLQDEILKKYGKLYKEIQKVLIDASDSTKDSCMKAIDIIKIVNDSFENIDFFNVDFCIDDLNEFMGNDFDLDCDDDNPIGLMKALHDSGSTVGANPMYGCDTDSGLYASEDSMSDSIKDSSLIEDLVMGDTEFGTDSKTYFFKEKGSKDTYNSIKKKVSKYVTGIRKLIKGKDKNYEFVIPGCRTGKLDTNKLAEAYQGVPQVYTRIGKVETNKTTVCVLIDESGSMNGTKERMAREAAILLKEALESVPGVDLYIYGHSADQNISGTTEIYVYKEGNFYNPKFSLSESKARYENRDGVAIYETAKRVRKFTESQCIMFVLSDGEPCARDYHGTESILDTKNKVEEVEKMGFQVIQVGIEHLGESRKMFNNYIELSKDLDEFPKKLSGVIKKAVIKNKKTITT